MDSGSITRIIVILVCITLLIILRDKRYKFSPFIMKALLTTALGVLFWGIITYVLTVASS